MKRTQLFTRRELVAGLASVPVLGSMLRTARAAGVGAAPTRCCFLFFGNGIHPGWVPAASGLQFELTPHLSGLAEIKSKVTIVKNLNNIQPALVGHYMGSWCLFAGVDARKQPGNQGKDVRNARPRTATIDQVIASRLAARPDRSPLPSLQVAAQYEAPGFNTITFSTDTPAVPMPAELEPLRAYQRLIARFVPTSGDPVADKARLQALLFERKSVLDGVRADVSGLAARVSATDKAQLDGYLSSLRALEDELGAPTVGPSASCPAAPSAPDSGRLEAGNTQLHQRLLRQHMDVVAFAFQCGLTRVALIQMSEMAIYHPARWLGQSYEAHNLSHYIGLANASYPTPRRIELIIQHAQYWTGELTYFVNRLAGMKEGTSTVLDNSIALLATSNGDSNTHVGKCAPAILAGGAGGRLRPAGVVDAGNRCFNDLFVSIAQAMGLADVTTFGDPALNRGPLPGLAA